MFDRIYKATQEELDQNTIEKDPLCQVIKAHQGEVENQS